MSHRQFFDSLFELADVWCPDIDGAQYARFLDTLRTRLTVMKVQKRNGTVMRRLVRCWLVFVFVFGTIQPVTAACVPLPVASRRRL